MDTTPGGLIEPVQELIRTALDTLSASERKVARAILANYPIAGLETVAELAKRANVSPPTVVRFATRLGFSGYPAFQKRLMREVQDHLGSPLEQYSRPRTNPGTLVEAAADVFVGGVAETMKTLPESEVAAAAELLADSRRRVVMTGGNFSQMLAIYLAAHLQLLRPNVATVTNTELPRLSAIADASKHDVFVVFDYRRYDMDTVTFAQRLAERGSSIILFTDRWLSPAADIADVVLPALVESPSPFDSLVPAMAVVETVIAATTDRLAEAGRARVEAIESMRTRTTNR